MKIFIFQMIDDRDDLWPIKAETELEAKQKLVNAFKEEEYPGYAEFTLDSIDGQYCCLGDFIIIE